jgi:hypothetical protein
LADARAEIENERGHEHRADDEGVKQNPKAIVKPSSVSVLSGSVASIVNVPASTIPAEVITPTRDRRDCPATFGLSTDGTAGRLA